MIALLSWSQGWGHADSKGSSGAAGLSGITLYVVANTDLVLSEHEFHFVIYIFNHYSYSDL